jgi:hypothetical protein
MGPIWGHVNHDLIENYKCNCEFESAKILPKNLIWPKNHQAEVKASWVLELYKSFQS